MKKRLLIFSLFLLIALVAIVSSGCSGGGTPTRTSATPQTTAVSVRTAGRVIAEGKVMPARSAALSFSSGGTIAQVSVALGDRVEAGKVLAQLDTRQLELAQAQADANLAAAQAKLSLLKRGPTPEDQAAAQQNVVSAQAAYDNLSKPSPNDLAALKADVDKSKAVLDQAQAAYDRIGGDSNPQANMAPQRTQLQAAWLDYQKALTLYNSRTTPNNAQVQQALAAVQNAKKQLADLQPTADDIAAAQAGVNAAQAARDLAAEQVKNAKLTAPFAGVITSLDFKAGEFAAPGTPGLRLADTSNWQVETTDLTELNIVNVKEGDAVTVSFDAIPDLQLSGKVGTIKGYGENRQGDIVYPITILLDKQDDRLRWNMTAKVNIEAKK